MMKFLALVLLLAVGSQAASLQADAPSELQHFRSLMHEGLDHAKSTLIKATDQLDDTQYKDHKATLAAKIDELFNVVKLRLTEAAPHTDAMIATVLESTAPLRSDISTDFKALEADLTPKGQNLKEVVAKHLVQYRDVMKPVFDDYQNKLTSLEDQFAEKLKELHGKMETNVEETKKALTPILDTIHAKANEAMTKLKDMATPYINEYKEQLKSASTQLNTDEITKMTEKIQPLGEGIKTNLAAIAQMIMETVNKS